MNRQHHVVIADCITGDLGPEQSVLGDLAQLVALDAKHEDELVGHIEDADAIMLYHEISLSQKTIQRLKHCKLIVRCGVGYDNIDRDCASDCGIPVANVPDYGTEEVADSAIGMMLALTRGITFLNSRLKAGLGSWSYTQIAPLSRLRGEVFGIVGLGRIGTAAAMRAKAFGMDVVFYDPYKEDGYDKALGIRRAEHFDELLEKTLVLSLHCPLTDETYRLIDEQALAGMPTGSYLVNTARGALVDTSVIPGAIESGQLAGAAIDVLPCEPPAVDDPLIAAWRDSDHPAHHRILVNPHSAFYCEKGMTEMRMKGAEACRRALCEEPIRNRV